ncbi:uncharacterized protein M421DRAFT_424355 [Didymella exigua CBS 183.55]|uniref:Uncharacterized protein n=1 Tax=Didymella exigua CBS 183.55 TaxID=1150837 RepID=A0A6A5RCL9_9PLEO|nr:uncharacterized protein M421DRAFT_424355 [Didymella exigua CBS 183.55]KAF1924938.1 hypothetical protein M421DRAFT_424355 [Didymella exigua CBS 183.55]
MEVLKRLGNHKRKYDRKADTGEVLSLRTPGTADKRTRLNRLQLFESGFLSILLSCAGLESTDIDESEDGKLATLLTLLDKVVNPALIHDVPLPANVSDREEDYPRLQMLLAFLDSFEGSLYIATGHDPLLFLLDQDDLGAQALSSVQELNRLLDGLRFSSGLDRRRPSQVRGSQEPKIDNPTPFFYDNHYEFIERLLHSVNSAFKACRIPSCNALACDKFISEATGCKNPSCKSSHKLMLRLQDAIGKDISQSVGVDVFLYCPVASQSPATELWQSVQCRLESGSQNGFDCSQLCKYVRSSLRDQEGLMLFYNTATSTFLPSQDAPKLPETDPNRFPIKSLRDLIEVDKVFDGYSWSAQQREPFKIEERRALAAKLALHLALCCYSQHTSQPWNRDCVQFLGTSSKPYDRATPYIQYNIGEPSVEMFSEAKDLSRLDAFTELAELLLEIEYGRPTGIEQSTTDVDKYLMVKNHLEFRIKAEDGTRQGYLQAVEACLRFHKILDAERIQLSRFGESEGRTCMELIWNRIVSKIVFEKTAYQPAPARGTPLVPTMENSAYEILPAFDTRLENDGVEIHWHGIAPPKYGPTNPETAIQRTIGRPDNDSLQSSHIIRQGSANDRSRNSRLNNDFVTGWVTGQPSSKVCDTTQKLGELDHFDSAVKTPSLNLGERPRLKYRPKVPPRPPVRFFSVNLQGSLDEERRRETAKWIKDFKALRRKYKTNRNSHSKLKIAILDSGLDMTHEKVLDELEIEHDRIKYESFVEGGIMRDECGHGTHVAGIILNLTTQTKIYVAKVMSSAKAREAEEASVRSSIVQALQCARREWEVDMISMSFGYSKPGTPDEVGKEIIKCLRQGIAVFASASNEGGNKPRTYPGNYPGVFCIHSSTPTGNASTFSPSRDCGKENYTAVGECIKSWWPADIPKKESGTDDGWKHLSGTSFATPIAVSIAAFMIGYIRTHLSEYRWNIPPTSPDGIRRIFQLMMHNRGDGYDWLSPQYFFDRFQEDRIKADLISDRDGLGGYKL